MSFPLPVRRIGWSSGSLDAEVTVDAFLDLQCPYSKRAFTTLTELLAPGVAPRFRLRVLIFTVNHHRQAWDLAKAAYALVTHFHNPWIKVVEALYRNQDSFTNAAFEHKTHADLEQALSAVAAAEFGADAAEFLELLRSEAIHQAAKETSRLAAARSVWVAPTFLINDFPSEHLSSKSTLEEWVTLLCRDRC